MSNSLLLSEQMLKSEKAVAYSTSVASDMYSRGNICQFTICTSESQGFSWNQDIFASQYQQLCKVIYDGHVDSVDSLLQKVSPPANGEKGVYVDVFNDDEMDQDNNYIINQRMEEDDSSARKANYDEWRYRLSKELNKPRRRSERSISFVSDSKNGTYHSADVIEIDVESVSPENTHLRKLVREV